MISTIYKSDGIYYGNHDQINLFGFNVNFQKRIFNHLNINSVYSYTDAKSDNPQLEEGISNHTLNFRLKYSIYSNLNILWTIKYNSKKNIFLYDTQENKELNGFNMHEQRRLVMICIIF